MTKTSQSHENIFAVTGDVSGRSTVHKPNACTHHLTSVADGTATQHIFRHVDAQSTGLAGTRRQHRPRVVARETARPPQVRHGRRVKGRMHGQVLRRHGSGMRWPTYTGVLP